MYICRGIFKLLKMKKIILLLYLGIIGLTTFAQKQIQVEDIYARGIFWMRSVYGINSMNDGEHYTSLNSSKTSLIKYRYETGEVVSTLFNLSDIKEELLDRIFDYSFNKEEDKILFSVQHEPIYRHSFHAEYFIYNIQEKSLIRLSENGKQQLASFSPDGKKVAFVRDNNIYIRFLEGEMKEQQLTFDGERNRIINGAPDWVYEEEFSFHKAYQWSLDSEKIAFYKTDESNVKMFSMTLYGSLYPEKYDFKYPKAGEDNSKVSIHMIDLTNNNNIIELDLGDMNDKYIPRIFWTGDYNVLGVIKMNRLQNIYELILCDAKTGNSSTILTLEDDKYIEVTDNLLFINRNSNILMTHEQDGYNHLYLYDINGNMIRQITKGEWEVTKMYGFDHKTNTIYFQCAKSSPFNRDVYSIDTEGNNLQKLSVNDGSNDFVFSKEYKYYINYYSSINTPLYVTLHNNEGELIRELETNKSLNAKISEYSFSNKEFFSFSTSDGVELNGWMIKPNKFKKNKKHPVLMYVYGGPGHQTVRNMWDNNMAWWQLLAQQGYIIVSVDNRGTGARGKEFRQITYGQLGKYETIDQIEAAKFLGNQKFVDKDRIGIFGWSYGGYMAALCMTIGAEYFKAGISVAPVTNWRHYDTIYTERYNGLPQDNADGYDNNSPVSHVDKLKGNLLLVHGTGDDNVHVENSIDLANKLIDANKQFEMLLYPNRDHGIHGGFTRLHLYNKMTNFVINNL